MPIFTKYLTISTSHDIDIVDITDHIQQAVTESSIVHGQICAFVGGSTASITTIEFEPGVVSDLQQTLKQIAPPDKKYAHDQAWGDGNGYSHVLAALMGPSRHFPITSNQIPLGTWQQIVLIDFDNKPRQRTIQLHMMGE